MTEKKVRKLRRLKKSPSNRPPKGAVLCLAAVVLAVAFLLPGVCMGASQSATDGGIPVDPDRDPQPPNTDSYTDTQNDPPEIPVWPEKVKPHQSGTSGIQSNVFKQ